ncbi:hypothetical protein [Aeromonas veronii]|uniref:hypothetical protein n=1 Tax=Aeromonas veronii TaxID=654 RepID=UPI003B9E1F28
MHEKIILNQNLTNMIMMLDALEQRPLLALLFATEQKYTSGAAMESAIRSPLHKQVRSVSEVTYQTCGAMPECRTFCHWLRQQFAGGEPDREEGGLATL